MLQPTRLISTPFAQEGEKTEIQNATGEFDNSATYRLGFPPLTMQSIRLGGKPPKGTDFNGVLFDITENISFLCKGGRYQYNAGLSTLIGGYPEGSNLLLDDNVTEVVSTVAGNQNNPNTDMTGWTFKPNRTTTEYVTDGNQTQDQINLYGGKKYDMPVGGYPVGAVVVLDDGDIVKSTIDSNTNNPNVDMTGWEYSSLTPSNNLSDVADKAEARTNLEVYSKTETDSIAGTPDATETVAGKAKIATTAIAQAGVNDTDIITSKKLRDALNASGSAPISACRAWVNFSASGGVITVKGSLNIASVTRVSAGVYTVNFNIPMPIENYAVFVSNSGYILNNSRIHATSDTSNPTIKTVNSVQVAVSGSTTFGDTANMSVGVFC